MSEVRLPLENENEKESLHEDVLSIDDTKNQDNHLTNSEYIDGEQEGDKIEERKDPFEEGRLGIFSVPYVPPSLRGVIKGPSIISQDNKSDGSGSCVIENKSESSHVNTSHDRIKEGAMQAAKIEEVMVGEISHGKDDGAPLTREVIKEAAPIAAIKRTGKLSANVNGDDVIGKSSRSGSIKGDGRKLKTATLDRVGRMFKSRPSSSEIEKAAAATDGVTNVTEPDEKFGEQPSRKEKTNSLGRMLKLVDKDGAPKKLFAHPRAGSLSRIFRKHSNTENNETIDRTEEESPGIFSRMFNHLRGRSASSGNRSNTSNARERADKGKASLPPKVPVASKLPPGIPLSSRPPLSGSSSSSSAMPEKQQPTRSPQRTNNLASYEP